MPLDGKTTTTGSQQVYWAKQPAEELVTTLIDKTQKYFSSAQRRGLQQMWAIAWAQYYGTDPARPGDMATQTLARTGPEGEFTRFRINEVRSFIKQGNTIAQGERPAFQCLVLNSDHGALASVEIADSIVSYLYKKALGEEKERLMLESEGVFGAGYGHLRWDFEGGDDVEVDEPIYDEMGEPVIMQMGPQAGQPATMPKVKKSGSPYVDVMSPWEVVLDPTSRDIKWAIVRERASKWEVAATYPELEEDILESASLDAYVVERLFGYDWTDEGEDDCIVEHFYHPACRALPEGRYVGLCGDVVLWDVPCPVSEGIPLIELCGGKFIGSAFGYADSWDLISIQEMIDQLCSDTASNLSTFGRQTLVYDKGGELDFDMIALGLRAIAKTPGSDPPIAINYASMPDSVQWFLTYLHSRHESISGLNSVARGNPASNIKSGQMAALFHSIAIEFQSARQAALDGARMRMANLMLDMVRSFADAPFLVEVAGVSERPYLAEFTKENVAGVRKVNVETTNPMQRSQAGRFEMFNAIKDLLPEQRDAAVRGLTTGDWSGMTEDSRSSDLRIVWENEQLMDGQDCPVGVGDHPFKHIQAHWDLVQKMMSTPNKDEYAQEIQLALQHILNHLMSWQSIDPRLATTLNIPLPPPLPGSPTAMMSMLGMPAPAPPASGPAPGSQGSTTNDAGTSLQPPAAGAERDTSGVKLPNAAVPPPGSQAQPMPQA